MTPCKSIAIQAARCIVVGDVDTARDLIVQSGRLTWEVCEMRAIVGAVRFIRERYGAKVLSSSILFPETSR